MFASILLILDLVYYCLSKNIYIGKIEEIQKQPLQFRIEGAIIRYIAMVVGLYVFVLSKRLSPAYAFVFGLVFGGIFNGTMYASFRNWNGLGGLLDTLWLSSLFAITTYLTYKI